MSGKWERSISCVGVFEVAREIPESSVMRGHDVCQLLDKSLGCFGSNRDIINEGESYVFLRISYDVG